MPVTGMLFNVQKFSLHDGPGIRTTVFLKGCPLRCPWCANPESRRPGVQTARDGAVYGRETTVEALLPKLMQDEAFYRESGGGVTLSGGEPLFQPAFALALLARLRREGIHTALETTGFARADVFARAIALADCFLFDLKHPDAERHLRITGVPLAPILANLRAAIAAGKQPLVRIPVIPGYNDSAEAAQGFAALLISLGIRRVELLPFHQFGEKKHAALGLAYALEGRPALRPADLADFRGNLAARGIECLCEG
jgi:pyruvate formate lyase activating enzyme